MELKFNILWLDDQEDTIEDAVGVLAPRLLDDGFELVVHKITDFSDEEAINKTIREARNLDIDLIMLDFDLGQGKGFEGNDLAVNIRRIFKHKDIVFYSGHDEGIPALLDALCEKKIEGAYCATRRNLVDPTYDVIQNFIKKVVDINHMRGIVMAETSDLDDAVSECLRVSHEGLPADDQQGLCEYIIASMQEASRRNAEKIDKLNPSKGIGEILKLHPAIFSSDYRRRALRRALESHGWPESQEHKEKHSCLERYKDEVGDYRDTLAHAKVEEENGQKVLKGRNGKTVSDGDMPQIRGNILGHKSNLEQIQLTLNKGKDA